MKLRNSAAILGAATVLGACATGVPFRTPESAPADGAHVYVYRPFGPAAAHAHDVVVDGRPPLRLPSSGWVRLEVSAGRHEIRVTPGIAVRHCAPLSLDVENGQTVYVHNTVRITDYTPVGRGGFGSFACELKVMPAQQALEQLQGLREGSR